MPSPERKEIMGMSTSIFGFKPPDEKWKKMKEVRDACLEAGVMIPSEVDDFFEGESPDNAGVRVNLEEHECVSKYRGEVEEGFEVDVRKLPKDVVLIRFVNSW